MSPVGIGVAARGKANVFMIQATLSGLVTGSLFALIAVGFNLTFMVNRTVNFAHGQWVALGSLLAFTFLVQWQVPLLVTFIGAAVVLGLMGILLERIGIRPLLGHSLSLGFIMSTLAIGIILENVALFHWGTTALYVPSPLGEARLSLLGAGIYPQELLVLGVTALVLLALAVLYRTTWLGRALRVTAENVEAAELMGVNTKWIIACAYGLSGTMAAIAGVLVAPLTGALATAGGNLGLKAFAIAIVGGLDSISGTLLAGLLLGVAEQYIALYLSPGLKDVLVFGLVIAMLMLRPFGLFGSHDEEKV
jgi:branched-chain amino acid transport system permease protein